MKKKKPRKVLLVYSECDNSPQLFSIYQKLVSEIEKIEVILILTQGTQIEQDFRNINANFVIWPPRRKFFLIAYCIALLIKIMRGRFDTVFASGQTATYLSIPAAYMARTQRRIFIRHHADFHHLYKMRLGILADLITSTLATRIVGVSVLVGDILVYKERIPISKVTVIPNGFNVQEFLAIRGTLHLQKDFILIGTVGRFTHLKGLVHVAEAFAILAKRNPKIKLIMLGAPSDESSKIRSKLSTLDSSRYEILDSFWPMPEYYGSLDILIHIPIGPKEEAFGLVYLEALASGCLCAFTKSGVLLGDRTFDKFYKLVEFENTGSLVKVLDELIHLCGGEKHLIAPESLFDSYSLQTMSSNYWNMFQND